MVFVFLTTGFLLFSAWPREVPLRTADLLQLSANGSLYFGCSYSGRRILTEAPIDW